MEVSINNNINQLRFFSNLITMQQLDSKLIAFCTILTVALSIMLSFKQSRGLLLNATSSYSFYNVKKCIKCLQNFKANNFIGTNSPTPTSTTAVNLNANGNNNNNNNSNGKTLLTYNYFYSCTKYFKLKRLRNIAYIASKLTTNTLRLNSYKYLFKTFNATFSKMKRTTTFHKSNSSGSTGSSTSTTSSSTNGSAGSSNSNRMRRILFKLRFRTVTTTSNPNTNDIIINENDVDNLFEYCPSCDNLNNLNTNKIINEKDKKLRLNNKNLSGFSSAPVLTTNNLENKSTDDFGNRININKVYSESNFNSARYNRPKNYQKCYNSKVRLYKKLPLRSISRAWGEINSINLPVWCRKPCFYFYSWVFSCNLDECDSEDITEYKNLSEFFRRALKPNARKIDQYSCLISPCDGKILHFGKVDKGYLEQVKGVNYLLEAFLGEQTWPKDISGINESPLQETNETILNNEDSNHLYEKNILYDPENCLYHCVIYLAPGDYHRFHSPTDWEIFFRRHFPGELFSVNPSVARWLQGLFNLNERVVYYGKWKYGFFSMAPVGATNVGSIRVYMDKDLTTNNKESKLFKENLDHNFCKTNFSTNGEHKLEGVKIGRGENFGEFNLGSTIVLIFEAPKNFEFNIQQNEKVLWGSQLGSVCNSTYL